MNQVNIVRNLRGHILPSIGYVSALYHPCFDDLIQCVLVYTNKT